MVAVIPPRTVRASSWITDYLVTGSPAPTDIAGLSNPLDDVLSVEFAAAQSELAATAVEVLLAAFGRAVARAVGDGRLDVDVDVDGDGNPATGRAGLQCRAQRGLSATTLLSAGREALRTVEPVEAARTFQADVRFSYRTAFPGPAPDTGHLLALHACRDPRGPEVVHLDWWYDIRSFDRSTVEELAGQFPLAVIELASDGVAGGRKSICAGQ
ncbi:MAG TPA: hypothetical protein VIU87_10535 [Mycobacterium sp.]